LGWRPIVDPMNHDPRFLRSRIRHEVLPLLDEVARRDVVPNLTRLSQLAADEGELLDQLAAQLDPTHAKTLRDSPRPLARRAVRAWLQQSMTTGPTFAEVERVLEVAAGDVVACEVEGGLRVSRRQQRLTIEPPTRP
jgi:tRNA(Ile)-lysidine synthase